MNNAKNFKVVIFDDQYTLISDQSAEHMSKVTNLVDTYMHEIADKSKLTDHKKIAVLAALKLASDLVLIESEKDTLKNYGKKLIDRIDRELLSS